MIILYSLFRTGTFAAVALALAAPCGAQGGMRVAPAPAQAAHMTSPPTATAHTARVILRFRCDAAAFTLRLSGPIAVLDTGARTYRLQHRPSSFDRRYASEEATFIQDGGSAVLVGAEGGPFVNCHAD